jgi:hypothetical protein
MSNPLLKPDDPRFRPKQLTQADGANPFAEGDAVLEAEAVTPKREGNAFAAPAGGDNLPFLPHYETTAAHRGGMLLMLTAISILGACLSIFVGYLGWLLPLLAIVPAGVVIFLAADDLKMMRLGGRDPSGRALTLTALILSSFLVVGIAVVVGLLIYWGWNLLPEGLG